MDEDLEDVTRNRQKMFERMNKKGSKGGADNKKSPPINKESGKGKKARVWDNQGHSTAGLDYSEAPSAPVSLDSFLVVIVYTCVLSVY